MTEPGIKVDASAKAEGFLYVSSEKIAVVSACGARDEPSTSLRSVLQACVAHFEWVLREWLRSLPDHRVFFFTATHFAYPPNALRRRRGVWEVDGLGWLPKDSRSPSVEILREDGGLCFAGLAQITVPDFFEAANFARMHSSSFLFVSQKSSLTEECVRSIAAAVFPARHSSLDWASVVGQVEDGESICVRASGSFDDREASLDAFLSAALLKRLGVP